ncbi:type-2 restriction enzyme DpnII [Clostridium acetireducens DSM 10703]|uniref:Type-2 restriction enzyme n=1 Tax=Clostridium acetireducens DSM 10703 TaxID=1121290 RepID=A0A1E8EYP5_9CLOT|nr:type II restriction endonuclease [Clostridium acetireducens]OFI06091.1 type-2 restriction enzyme DpnII [Clostridium acetireducens DSM 10703]
MKNTNYYIKKNLNSPNKVFNFLIDTLKDSIFTWNYFVDFDKAITNVKNVEKDLEVLNSLLTVDKNNLNEEFINLLKKYPQTRKCLCILIALRYKKLSSLPIIDDINTLSASIKKDLFNPKVKINEDLSKELLKFFKLTGLRNLFINKNISNIIDYCKGIEVGMDTNARKNRTGTAMESLIENYIINLSNKYNLSYIPQATKNKIYDKWNIEIQVDKIDRRFDFAILTSNKKLFLMEVNYYSSGGSKLKATAGEYKELYNLLNSQDIPFIWITDGQGWTTAKTALKETFLHNDYLFNLYMIADGVLMEVLSQ